MARDKVFDLEWNSHHPEVPKFSTQEEFQDALDPTKVEATVTKPYIYLSDPFKKACEEEKVARSFDKFAQAFVKEPLAISHESISAPMLQGHGTDLLRPLWKNVYPQSQLVDQVQAKTLSQVAFREWMYGLMPTAVMIGTEPETLGTM